MNNLKTNRLTIPLTPESYRVARQFAIEQETIEKSKQVYLNTLAVYAVKDFLEELSFATDLEQGDSWNPMINCFHDVADLVIPGLGKLECCPILEQETSVSLFQEVTENRIGYVVVRFGEDLSKVQLLGFHRALSSEITIENIQIHKLEPIENLIDYLFHLELGDELKEPQEIPIMKWFQEGIAQLDQFIGWALGEFELSAAGAKTIKEEKFFNKYIIRNLNISGQNYELRILPPRTFETKVASEIIEKTWRFQLRNLAPGGFIPGGFKLRLLTEDGQSFEENEDVAKTAEPVLYVDVTLETNEGLIWEIEPFPDDYSRDILRF